MDIGSIFSTSLLGSFMSSVTSSVYISPVLYCSMPQYFIEDTMDDTVVV